MDNFGDEILQATMAGLDAGLRVQHITTFNPACCATGEDGGIVLRCYPNFDHIPVRDGSGSWALQNAPTASAGRCMMPCFRSMTQCSCRAMSR